MYNSRQLRQFLPREGPKLALDELAWMEVVDENKLQEDEEEDEEEEEMKS